MKSKFIHIKATPAGISIVLRADAGKQQIGYSAAIRQLEEGHYDHYLSDGLRVVSEIAQASKKGWFKQSDEQAVIVWRWLVACLFIDEQLAKHGTIDATKMDGTTEKAAVYRGQYGGIVIYPATERFALANHIEGMAFERFSAVKAHDQIVKLYQHMAEADPLNGNLRLSQWGRESLAILHDGFIQKVNAEGWPETPTAH
ncbi:hypothetical protein [Rahnella woolbedingensis]|uniref:Uncharacterized protein n=1 Tax=Rahnella woolbedingensis TaxID=1510574 RepID=A0A419N9N7_9GAMM|nr:hypothetical protein [Rahnella woolbedingensis]RJT44538.1 hypothetical protein D6C13_10245 [Rahnella woolbedingensis]